MGNCRRIWILKKYKDMSNFRKKLGWEETGAYTARNIKMTYADDCFKSDCSKLNTGNQVTAITLQGKLLDDLGEPLYGANIVNITRNAGTSADNNGVFGLYAQPDDDIEISFVGFETIKTKAGNLGKVIQMKQATEVLPEVVITPEKCPLLCWLKKHKKEVLIGGGVLAVLVIGYSVSKATNSK